MRSPEKAHVLQQCVVTLSVCDTTVLWLDFHGSVGAASQWQQAMAKLLAMRAPVFGDQPLATRSAAGDGFATS